MDTLVAQMTKEELTQVIESVVERKLLELFDSVDDITLRPEVRERLLRQRDLVTQGERGYAFEEIVEQLDLG